jgi:signal transduction histidine kinase/DNA-binding NarL/FixJ family response regulator
MNSGATTLVVLLVEDDPDDVERMSVSLTSAATIASGTTVELVLSPSASAACVQLRHHAIDVVILDLTLPDARGLEALSHVRDAAPSVPIIVLAGGDDKEVAVQALRAGAQDFVLKPPPDGETMARILRYACERHRLLKALDLSMRESAHAARQWRLLAEVGRVLAASNTPSKAIADAGRLIVPEASDCLVVLLCGDADSPPLIEVAHADTHRSAVITDRARGMLGSFQLASGLPTFCDDDSMFGTGLAAALTPLFEPLQIVTGKVTPLRVSGRPRGFVLLGLEAPRPDSGDVAEFAQSLAERIGMALEQDRLLRQTQRAVAARDRAVSIVSHDLRNPLSTIQICASALLDPEPAPLSGVRQMAELIQRSAEWMQHIVRDLLDRTNLDSGHLTLAKHRVAVADILTAIGSVFGPIAGERAINLHLHAEADLGPFDADPDRLLQALANLMSNAMKFTPRGGRVDLNATRETVDALRPPPLGSRSIRFAVHDTGPGIAPENIERVFDWFWRAPGANDGAGLGLGIARALIEAHDGQLHVESEEGRGSTFWFTLRESN